MIEAIAWGCGIGGILLGLAAAAIPGFPGCAVAFLGLVAFAGLTDFAVVTREALVLAALCCVVGGVAQLFGPALGSRALAGSAGAATGAVIGACLGLFIPVPGVGYGLAVAGAVALGVVSARKEVLAWMRGVVGAAGGCCISAGIDALAVLCCAAILALADFAQVSGV
ncbi:MAG: DUF456 family protein [Deltaproteobacteria bacterium]|nr:MAG: DUF456 family protein [Deltaproteobacteria bacterium]